MLVNSKSKIVAIGRNRVREFLEALADKPFLTVTLTDDTVTIYVKGLERSSIKRIIQELEIVSKAEGINASQDSSETG